MLTHDHIDGILSRLPDIAIGVFGDLFLDRYLDIDSALTEPSIETGLDAYQVINVRSYPGALGTVINNLVALGVGRVIPISIIGDDGEGYELKQALSTTHSVIMKNILTGQDRRTPTYTKPMMVDPAGGNRELNRLDIKNRVPTPEKAVDWVLDRLDATWPEVDAWIILDQVSEQECGVVTSRVRDRLAQLSRSQPEKFVLADSRENIWKFQNVCLKPNWRECFPDSAFVLNSELVSRGHTLATEHHSLIFCTAEEHGIALFHPHHEDVQLIPGYPVSGAIDPVGAGDSCSAAIACAVASGLSFEQAAAFGNLVASITIQQLGVTGTATPEQVRHRWTEVSNRPTSSDSSREQSSCHSPPPE